MVNSIQYEELCRAWIAHEEGYPIEAIESLHVDRPGGGLAYHQIDLYWIQESSLSRTIYIADAKIRRDKIDQQNVLLFDKVKQTIAAHRAMLITDVGFTSGAVNSAVECGMGLHILTPTFDPSKLPAKDRSAMREMLQDLILEGQFVHTIERKSCNWNRVKEHYLGSPEDVQAYRRTLWRL